MKNSTKNYGDIIQDIVNYWSNIKTEKQYSLFADKVKNTTFGTYGTIPFFEVFNNFDIKFINNHAKQSFIKEVSNIFNA